MVHQVLLPSGLAKGNARMRAALDAEDDEDEDDDEDWDVEEADIDEEEFLE